jgi:hypothetical protein
VAALVPVAVSLLLAVLLAGCGESATDDPWTGTWREVGTAESYALTITPKDSTAYTIESPRAFLVPFSAYLKAGRLIIWGENADDVVYTVSYRQDSDQLTALSYTGERFSFRRVDE